jgi:hypothetical protein
MALQPTPSTARLSFSVEAVEKPFLQGKYLLLVKISDIIVNKIF